MKFKEDDTMMMRKLGRGITQPKEPIYRTPAITISPITDREGLDKAYALPDKVFVNGDTLYVAGTSYLQDVWDDLKIPFSQTSKAQRYSDAETIMAKNPQIKKHGRTLARRLHRFRITEEPQRQNLQDEHLWGTSGIINETRQSRQSQISKLVRPSQCSR